MKVALCTIARNENKYIREWVEHYNTIGIDKIFIYDNNPVEGETFDEVINDYIQSGFVEVIDVRGEQKGDVFNEAGINLQPASYIDCYENRLEGFDWVCFFDVDEFLTFREGHTLESFLSSEKFSDVGSIMIPWEIYGDNDLLSYDNRPVKTRFTTLAKKQIYAVKSIVKVGYTIENKKRPNFIYFFELNELPKAWIDGTKVIHHFIWAETPKSMVDNAECVLNHYKTKSLDEFVERSYGRHYGTAGHSVKFGKVNDDPYKEIFKTYFTYNEKTDEKINYIKTKYDYTVK